MKRKLCKVLVAYVLLIQSLWADWTSNVDEIEHRFKDLQKQSEFQVERNIFLKEEIKDHIAESLDKLERAYEVWNRVWKQENLLQPFVLEIKRHEELLQKLETRLQFQSPIRA